MSKRNKPPRPETCDDRCDDFCYIGEGCAVCNRAMPPKMVLEGWSPTDDFYWCGGGVQKCTPLEGDESA